MTEVCHFVITKSHIESYNESRQFNLKENIFVTNKKPQIQKSNKNVTK